MANTVIAAAQGVLTGSLVTLFTVPTNRKFAVKALSFCGQLGSAVTLIVEIKQTSGGTQRRYIERTLNDNATDLAAETVNQVIDTGGLIQASGDGATYILSGILVDA